MVPTRVIQNPRRYPRESRAKNMNCCGTQPTSRGGPDAGLVRVVPDEGRSVFSPSILHSSGPGTEGEDGPRPREGNCGERCWAARFPGSVMSSRSTGSESMLVPLLGLIQGVGFAVAEERSCESLRVSSVSDPDAPHTCLQTGVSVIGLLARRRLLAGRLRMYDVSVCRLPIGAAGVCLPAGLSRLHLFQVFTLPRLSLSVSLSFSLFQALVSDSDRAVVRHMRSGVAACGWWVSLRVAPGRQLARDGKQTCAGTWKTGPAGRENVRITVTSGQGERGRELERKDGNVARELEPSDRGTGSGSV